MNAIDQSLNRIPCHTDWHRYDSPTVIRRHGRSFLERSWKPAWATKTPVKLSLTELHTLVDSYGGHCVATVDYQLLLFDDHHRARRCDSQLIKLGLSTQRWGCHIQLFGVV
ncbi:MAG: hypothetical protein CTY16_08335 [Methylobacter sp.]|nr:MAG: hypothetical protein CTY16_08335 [Methylobacter sp.]